MRLNPSRWRAIAVSTAILALAGASAPALAVSGGIPAIPLNTGQEVPGSDTGASGFFSYTIAGDQLCYTLEARDLSVAATAAHIHVAPRNVAGDVVVPLTVGSGTSWTETACATVTDADLLAAIAENPRDYYVNVHTPTFPGGEIRGQLK
ncbi:CHRD domain-containing protein [Sinomonas mesophila]|uniref:CHRD domain-containing protein n=1 Tax=Sinomonas mesophila TaxID=1531955 RepID=UPI000985B056|nr:CHRD domain-containing protein [Sinomonas mesophila]